MCVEFEEGHGADEVSAFGFAAVGLDATKMVEGLVVLTMEPIAVGAE